MPEAAAPEVDADPDPVLLVCEQVHVVVAAPHGPELGAGLLEKIVAFADGDGIPGGIVEQRVIHRRIVGLVYAAEAEADHVVDLVGDRAQTGPALATFGPEVRPAQVRPDGGVAARDVEAHPYDRHLIPVRCHASYRHDVSEVAVRHQRGVLSTRRYLVQLREGVLLMLAEDPHGMPPA